MQEMGKYAEYKISCLAKTLSFNLTNEDFKHAQNVWSIFDMTNIKNYPDLYLKTDVLRLTDCFNNFRRKCLDFYQLDPVHFDTTPGLSWNAALKMTKVSLELLTYYSMHLMVEKGVRGGVSTIITRYAKTNNKHIYMGEDFYEKADSVYLQ